MNNSNKRSNDSFEPLNLKRKTSSLSQLVNANLSVTTQGQIESLISKDYVLLKRSKSTLLLMAALLLICGYMSSKDPFYIFFAVCINSFIISKRAIDQLIKDQELNFKATFKLMGLKDSAYILSRFVSDFLTLSVFDFTLLSLCSLFTTGGLGVFSTLGYLGYFILIKLLFNSSLLLLSYCFAGFAGQSRSTRLLSTLFLFLLMVIPVLTALKAMIGKWESEQKVRNWGLQEILDLVMLPVPFGPFFMAYRNGYGVYTGEQRYQLWLDQFVPLVFQNLVYFGLYFVTSGLSLNPAGRGKRRPTGLLTDPEDRDVQQEMNSSLLNEMNNLNEDEEIEGRNKDTEDRDKMIRAPKDRPDVILRIRNVLKRYGKFEALKGVSMDISTNGVTCILGHNGAGKTTLINSICGMNRPTKGTISLDHLDVYATPGVNVLAGSVGYCTAQDVLYENMTVSEFLMFIAMMKGVKNPTRDVIKSMRKCDLTKFSSQLIKNLSGGTKRRTTIGSAIIGSPRIIVMDEPSSGVDPDNRRQLWKLINSLKSRDNVLILTTHHLEEAEYLSNDVIILDRGEVEIRGSPVDIIEKFGIGYRLALEGLEGREQLGELVEAIHNKLQELSIEEKEELRIREEIKEGEQRLTGTEGSDASSSEQDQLTRPSNRTERQSRGVFKRIEVEDSSLENNKRAILTIPIKHKAHLGEIIRQIEQRGIDFEIESNTLEDAFVDLGENQHEEKISKIEKEEEVEDRLRDRQALYKDLFLKQYSTSMIRLNIALIYRRYALFFTSLVQILLLLCIVVIPAVGLWTFAPTKEIEQTFYFLPLVIMAIYLLIGSFYAYLPFYERKYRIRYLLKMVGCDSFTYVLNMFFTDFLFSTVMLGLSWGLLCLLFSGEIDVVAILHQEIFWTQVLHTLLWTITFITQSYAFQSWYKESSAGVSSVPWLILLTSIVEAFIWLIKMLTQGDMGTVDTVCLVVYIFAPLPAFFKLSINNLSKAIDSNNAIFTPEQISTFLTSLALSAVFYLGYSIFRDWKRNRVLKRKKPIEADPVKTKNKKDLEKNTIYQEAQRARNTNSEFPIQAYRISKFFQTVHAGSFYALRDVSICLGKGETLGILGPNGAGKTTLFNILSTYHNPNQGTINNFGKDIKLGSEFFEKSGICAQDDIQWDTLSVSQHLRIVRMIKGIPKSVEQSWLNLLEMEGLTRNTPSKLSSGMKRKLSFIMACIGNPKYKFLDEATTGMDPLTRKRIKEIMDAQKALYGSSCIFTTHTMNEAEKNCDRIMILVNGKAYVIDSVANLRKLTGGFTLTLYKNSAQDLGEEIAKEHLRAVFPKIPEDGFLVIEENQTKVKYDLYDIDELATKFDDLEVLKRDGVYTDFSLARKNLEDVFLALSRFQKPRNGG